MMFLLLAPLVLGEVSPPIVERQPPPAAPMPQHVPADTPAANIVFGEAFGNGLLYTVNYERLIQPWNVGLRGGVSYFTQRVSTHAGSGNLVLVTFPLVASYYLGWPQHKIQLGLGATILYLEASTDSQRVRYEGDRAGLALAATAVVGYRYVPREGGFSCGIGFTPLIRTSRALAWGGLDAGYAF